MTHLRPDTVAIHRLRLRQPGGQGITPAHTGRLRQQIEWSDWPEAPGESWVFIRQVQARAPGTRLAQELVQATRRKVAGGGNDVMRFANLTELVATLAGDLVQGEAAKRWYWRRWSHLFRQDLAHALAALFAEHGERLNAVCARLAQQGILASVWQALDQNGAGKLLAELARRSGFTSPQSRWLETLLAPSDTDIPARFRIPTSLRLRWAPVLADMSPDDSRLTLALVLIGQECAPLMLQQEPAGLVLQLARILVPAAIPTPIARPTASAPSAGDSAPSPSATAQQASEPAAPEEEANTHQQKLPPNQQAAAALSPRGQEENSATTSTTPESSATAPAPAASEETTQDLGSREADQPPLRLQESLTDTGFHEIQTAQGGLLYLLNFLNRPEAQSLMGDYWETLPNGWGWLYRLGQELALDATDPIVPFLAAQLGFEHPEDLDQLPPLPARDRLLLLAQRWYGGAGLWQPKLLQLQARIQASPSHVDMYASLNAVQLPVRLAGLDINPDWLPWLGRVVTFHYDGGTP